MQDRPGILAEIALACGQASVNIEGMQVFPGDPTVIDEFVVTAPDDMADVADYSGHDILDLQRRNGTSLRISRALQFTPSERARAQALLSLVSDAVAALHQRCSVETLYARYQVPLRMPMSTRMTRRLVMPEAGLAIVVQSGLDLVGHGIVEQVEDRWTYQVLIEDAWQGRGLGAALVKQGAGRAKALGAERLTFITAGSNDVLLRTIGSAGFVARVERYDGNVHITVPLTNVAPIHP